MGEKTKRMAIYLGLFSLVFIVAAFFGIKRDIQAENYKNEIRMDYQRCFTETVQYVDDLQLSLEKSKFVNDPGQMMRLSGEIYRQASSAAANLALLPLKTEPLEHLSEFLNQVGNYAYSLSFKMMEGESITEEEYQNLKNLEGYARNIAQSLDKNLEDLYNGTLDIRRSAEGSTPSGIDKVMGEIETQLHDYPALIYDGPFSSHLTDRKPLFLEGRKNITAEDAVNVVKKFMGEKTVECVEEKGNIPAYYIYDKEGVISAAVTKQGGYLLSYLNDRTVGEAKANIGEAKVTALTFLENLGFVDMKESYYEIISDVAVINYSAVQSGYTLYPDLVKVKVALDTCEVVGCETRGYLMYHKTREIPQIKISKEQAEEKINPHVEILSTSLAVIPSEGGAESFCWQIEGSLDNRHCLIYINTQTGAEEKLFLLIESETGTLAV
ncbi:MAG: germination protein YpeB [Clostridia bacterium]|nr:germination protein YpeB [Clostridia bacterium]